ncbi:MAG: glycosyltransferase family 4 protein [Acidobacteriota bacterium]|nr:glycosyltransferase family 4 protein [Acidobacteriota bacterium]
MFSLLSALPLDRFEITLVCPASCYPMFEPLQEPNRRVICLDLMKFSHLGAMRRMASILRQRKIDIAHAHQFYATLFLAPIATACRIRGVVETAHVREAWRRSWVKRSFLVDRLVYTMVDRFIAVSKAIQSYLIDEKHCHPSKVALIYNGRDLDRYRASGECDAVRRQFGVAPQDMLLVHIGRLSPQKGHAVLLRALPVVIEKFPQTKLLLVGEGDLAASLLDETKRLGLEGRVIFAGFQSAIPRFLEAADLVVLPSLWEGLPLIAIEAGGVGKAIVATAVDGTPEVVMDGITGLLVPPNDSGRLAEAIVTLLADEGLRKRMGANARSRAEAFFDIRQQASQTAALYESLMTPYRKNADNQPVVAAT